MEEFKEPIGRLLLKVIIAESLSEEEQLMLDSWIKQSPANETVYREITDPGSLEKRLASLRGYDHEMLWYRIQRAIQARLGMLI
jgi:hypothetical protein